jgi:hypothetical protein
MRFGSRKTQEAEECGAKIFNYRLIFLDRLPSKISTDVNQTVRPFLLRTRCVIPTDSNDNLGKFMFFLTSTESYEQRVLAYSWETQITL